MYTVSSFGLRSIWMLALVLIALVAASLDAAPDPPALDPHAATVKAGKAARLDDFARVLRRVGPEPNSLFDSRLKEGSIMARGVPLTEIIERNQASEPEALVRHGSDPSPPQV